MGVSCCDPTGEVNCKGPNISGSKVLNRSGIPISVGMNSFNHWRRYEAQLHSYEYFFSHMAWCAIRRYKSSKKDFLSRRRVFSQRLDCFEKAFQLLLQCGTRGNFRVCKIKEPKYAMRVRNMPHLFWEPLTAIWIRCTTCMGIFSFHNGRVGYPWLKLEKSWPQNRTTSIIRAKIYRQCFLSWKIYSHALCR